MRPALLAALMLCTPIAAGAADALKISQIEQDILRLQQQIQEQARQIEALRLRLAQPPSLPEIRDPARPAPVQSGTWLDASRWARVQSGMSELEVITLLGPPTSMRSTGDDRVLLYAIEIGASGFLGGSVTLRERRVLQVQSPQLR
jgi:hypothetical protein